VSVTAISDNPVTKLLNDYRGKLLTFDQIQNVPEPTWLIQNFIMTDSVAVIWGDPSAGKSFIALDWAMSIACGEPWFGNFVTRGNVFYVLGEGVAGMKMRANSWELAHGLRPHGEELVWCRKPVRLLEAHSVELITQLCAEQAEATKQPTRLIVIDTLARALVGHSENDSTDMGKLVDVSEQIREATKATVLFVHHSNQSAVKKMRGSSALNGAVDTEIEMEHIEGEDVRHLRCKKQKDAAPFLETAVYLQKHGQSLVPGRYQFGGL
jgi:RecA-family ATPase